MEKCRANGINVPIIPVLNQSLSWISSLFCLRFSIPISRLISLTLRKRKTDAEAAGMGVEWCILQAKDLIANNVPSIHFYSMMATQSVKKVAGKLFIEKRLFYFLIWIETAK